MKELFYKRGRVDEIPPYFASKRIFSFFIGLLIVVSLTSGVFGEKVQTNLTPVDIGEKFIPSGYMGDFDAINCTDKYLGTDSGQPENLSVKIIYQPNLSTRGNGWAGIYWQFPESNWGELPGQDYTGYTNLTFRAKGVLGSEKAEFKIGGIMNSSKPYHDSVNPAKVKKVTLTKDWKEYNIDLKGENLSSVIGGFCWDTSFTDNPKGCTIFIDDIILK